MTQGKKKSIVSTKAGGPKRGVPELKTSQGPKMKKLQKKKEMTVPWYWN